MANLITIKNWFKTGFKPNQLQFWETFDSFWHKEEGIPVAKIDGLNDLFTPINNHFNSNDAHALQFLKTKIYQLGQMQIFKGPGNFDDFLEQGDVASFLMNDGTTFIRDGQYLGGDIQDIENWNASPLYFS